MQQSKPSPTNMKCPQKMPCSTKLSAQHHLPHNRAHHTASSEGQIDRQKTRRYRYCTRDDICGIEKFQNKIEYSRNRNGQYPHKYGFFFRYTVYLNLRRITVIRIFKPRNQAKKRHRHRHAEIRNHLPIVCKRIRDYTVKQTENYHQQLSERISFCIKYQRCNTNQIRCKRQEIFSVEYAER